MLSGAFTSSLRRAYDSGEDIRGAGILNVRWKAQKNGGKERMNGCIPNMAIPFGKLT